MAEPFIGEIKMTGFGFPPKGWAACNGQLLPINQNQALFALLGTTFGGDGRVTFALPDLRGATPMHVSPTHPLGQANGEAAHVLSSAELPPHSHSIHGVQADASSKAPANLCLAFSSEDTYSSAASSVATHPGAIGVTGGGAPHPNLQPYLVINFIVALVGIFPARN